MVMRSNIKILYLFLVLCFLQSYIANAAHEKVNGRLQGASFQTSQTLSIFDNKYLTLSATTPVFNFKEAGSKTTVMIGVDNYTTFASVAYDLTINILLNYKTYTPGPGPSAFTSYPIPFALTVKYDPVTNNVTYPDLSAYVVNGGYGVSVKVVSIYDNLTSTFITSAPANLYLEAEIDAERYYDLDYTYTPYTFPSVVSSPITVALDPVTNEYVVQWAKLEGAEEYDLEWCWVSSDVVTPFVPVIDFKNNSTRIRTTDQFYRVTNIFESGYVYFRLRGVGRYDVNSNQKFEGYYYSPWTWDDFTPLSSIPGSTFGGGVKGTGTYPNYHKVSNDHEKLKNWQYSATYAEEGKKKEVISYFDGTLLNRQTVTKNNSDNNAIVGETYYDYNGRAAIQALPVPVPDANIKFYEYNVAGKWGFNFNVPSLLLYPLEPYNKKHFDEDPSGNCPTNALGMDPIAGSSKYYSTNNTDKNFQQAYVPEAQNYPFVQTEYMPDNTGRIRRQSGVGEELKLGSNHETKYFYGTPTGQTELDRLFGSEVGYYNHYKKNMVIDPNGQVSISYIDQSGKTIATALAGPSPDNLKALTPAVAPTTIVEDLLNKVNSADTDTDLDNNILSQSGKELIFSSEMIVTDAGPYTFKYDMTGTALTYSCAPSLCYDCIYNLEIDIQDLCNNRPVGFTPIKKFVGNIASGEVNEELSTITYNTSCAGTITFTDLSASPIVVNLTAGTYQVIKKLSLDENAMKYYLSALLSNNSCVRSEQSFIDEETAEVDISGCNMTCEACVASLGTLATFTTNGGTVTQYNELVKACREPCEYTSVCESNYISLLADVSPGGQYADWEDGGNCNPSAFPLSVLNTSNLLPKKFGTVMPHWDESTLNYKNDDGTTSFITVTKNTSGSYVPAVKSTVTPTQVTPTTYTVKPYQLDNVCDFVLHWKKNWAKELVKFHPEYPYYEWCIQNSQNNDGNSLPVTILIPSNPPYTASINSSKDYDSLLLIVDDLTYITSSADQMKLVDPLGILASNSPNDPYFVEGQSNHWHLPTGGVSSNFPATPVDTINQYNGSTFAFNGKVYRSAIDRFLNYQDSKLNLWQYAYAMTSGCITAYNSVLTPTTTACWIPFPSPVSNMTNATWAKFKMLYQSLKQELQNEAAESYATNAPIPTSTSDAHNSCNDCIGNGSFNYFITPFGTWNSFFPVFPNWVNNWFLFPSNGNQAPCGIFNKDLYLSKIKRFQSTSDVTGLSYGSSANAGVYQTTGKCPVTLDLEVILNTLAQNNVITTALQLNNYPAFTQLLYNHVMGGPPFTYPGLGWLPTVSVGGLNLSAQFINGTTPVCTMLLDFPSPSPTYNWSNIGFYPIVNLYNIKFLAYSSGVSTFKIDADIKTGISTYTTITLNGSICGNIGACAFDPVCEPNGNAQSLTKLISTLVAGGDLCNTSVSLSNPPYNSAFTNTFGQLLPTSTTWNWNFNSTTPSATISPASSISNSITISFGSSINTLCSLMVANPNLLIKSCLPDPAGPIGKFIINYSYVTGTNTILGSVTGNNISITNSSAVTTALSMGDCDVVDPFCNTPEHKVRKDLEEFLQDAVVKNYFMNTTTASTVNITTNPMFSNLLQSYITTSASVNTSANITQTNYYFYTNAASASYTFNFSLCSENSTTPPSINSKCCTLTFSLNPTLGKTQNDITSLGKLFVSPNPTTGGQSYAFKMLAQFGVGGIVDTLYGSTTCFPIRDCAPCTNTVDYSTMSSNSIWKEDFTSLTPGFSIINNDAGTSCASFTDLSLATPPQVLSPNCLYAITNAADIGAYTFGPYDGSYSYFISLGGASPSENTTVYKQTLTFTSATTSDKCYGFSGRFLKAFDKDHELELWVNGTYVGKQYIPFEGYSVTPTWHLLNFGGATYKLLSGSSSIIVEIIAKPIPITGFYTGILTTFLGLDKLGLWEVPCGVIPCINEFKPDTFPVITYTNPCAQLLTDAAINNGKEDYAAYIDSLKAGFISAYIKKCMGGVIENFGVTYDMGEYQYTLYYYDQAGNLVRTVPPEGVKPCTTSVDLAQIKTDRFDYGINPKVYFTVHEKKTTYTYNSLNQLNKQETPDAGISHFWYDRLGRMVASQNAKQFNASPKDYSYTKYDELGRIKEVGQIQSGLNLRTMPIYDPMPLLCLDGILNDATYPITLNASSGAKSQVTATYYGDDIAYASIASIPSAVYTTPSDYLRSRVAATSIEDVDDNNPTTYNHATYYNYDVHGNVRELVQHNPALSVIANHEKKLIQYNYDLVSGKVNKVSYQPGSVDQFYHQYDYDAENRLTHVYTSKDNCLWDLDQKYFYYKHGPLARVETGDSKVNGTDYAYTLQGWIKGVNSNILTQPTDIGKDGFNTTSSNYSDLHKMFGRDAYGYSLNYFGHLSGSTIIKDYNPIDATYASTANNFIADYTTNLGNILQIGSSATPTAPALYNGNISHMVTSYVNNNPAALIPGTTNAVSIGQVVPQLSAYWYDQLNRIKEVNTFKDINLSTNTWGPAPSTPNSANGERFSYDKNGNLESVQRRGNTSPGNVKMDDLTYNYISGTNKLSYVDDDPLISSNYTDDIDDQAPGNYTYDDIGNLITDNQELITNIEWTVYGKIKKITRTSSARADLTFNYDAQGNRISKRVHTQGQPASRDEITYYLRDAQGNVMTVYTEKGDFLGIPTLYLTEQHLYGSSRIGVLNRNIDLKVVTTPPTVMDRIAGDKLFELSNHLGNVIAVVPDRKIPVVSGSTILSYRALPVSTSDYMAFGAEMPGRHYTSGSYRYSFNGKEKDPETNATGGSTQDYGMRIYNPSLGRFLSVDPLTKNYPMLTPYQFGSNRPIDGIDWDGLEWRATQDKEGNYTGFEWDPDNAYDSKGNLKDGYYLNAVKFRDEGTFNTKSNYNMGTAGAWVYSTKTNKNGTKIGVINYYDATIYPADVNKHATVKSGELIEGKVGTHKGKAAIVTTNIINQSDHIPVENGYNPAHPDRYDEDLQGGYADGIHLHWAFPGSNGKQTTGFDTKGKACSEGCLLIDRTKFSDFMKNFKKGVKIGIIIQGGGIVTPQKPEEVKK